jgi:hypothetical protein
MKLYQRLLAIFIALSASISGVSGDIVVSDSVSTAAGSISYSISKSDGIGLITQMPTVNVAANDASISAAIEGCSIQGAMSINGELNAKSASGKTADVIANIKGPAASVTNYNIYGYVTSDLAWAGQYIESARGTDIDLQAIGDPAYPPTYSYWAISLLKTHPSTLPVYTVNNWYQDAMGGSGWAMTNIYSGAAAVNSQDPNDWVDVYTGSKKTTSYWMGSSEREIGANIFATKDNFIKINDLSMGYADYNLGYSNVDSAIKTQNVYDYWYVNENSGINKKDTIYW